MRTHDQVEQALADLQPGRAVVVVDDEDRENEGDLVFAAQGATPELVAFTVRYTSGYICVGMIGDECVTARTPSIRGEIRQRRSRRSCTWPGPTGFSCSAALRPSPRWP